MTGPKAPRPSYALLMCATLSSGCGDGDLLPREDSEEDLIRAYGTFEGTVTTSAVLSANGTYGAGCVGRADGAWSVALVGGAPLDHAALSVVKANTDCVLSLTSLRLGPAATDLHTAATPIVLSETYPANGVVFSSNGGSSFVANAKLSALHFGAGFGVTVLVSDNAVTMGSTTAVYAYDQLITSDAPLSYWRFNESGLYVSDDFAGTSGATLSTRTGAVGATWTQNATASTTTALISDAGRVRVGTNKRAVYTASGAPGASDYVVSADIYVRSLLSSDQAGVVGRSSSAVATYYYAGLVISTTTTPTPPCYIACTSTTHTWELWKVVNGTGTKLGSYSTTAFALSSYRVALKMLGSSVRLAVDGVERVTVTDASISSAGSGGLLLGVDGGGSPSNTAGLHLDNLKVEPVAADSVGSNGGLLMNSPTLNVAGVLGTANDRSITFDGVDDYIEVKREIGDDFSVELWFKSTQGIGLALLTQWYQTAALLDASSASSTRDFGIGLRGDGKILAGTGLTSWCLIVFCDDDQTITSSGSTSYRDGNWHHVVFTRAKATGAMALYVDGAAKGTLTGTSTLTLDAQTNMSIGRLQSGGNYFAGTIDEVAVYNNVLTAARVLQHYQAGAH